MLLSHFLVLSHISGSAAAAAGPGAGASAAAGSGPHDDLDAAPGGMHFASNGLQAHTVCVSGSDIAAAEAARRRYARNNTRNVLPPLASPCYDTVLVENPLQCRCRHTVLAGTQCNTT